VFTALRIRRPVTVVALASALLCSMTVPAVARPDLQPGSADNSAALAQERYYSSYGDAASATASDSPALAQERYYSSYGDAEPLTLAQAPAVSDDTPWLEISLSVVAGLALLAAAAVEVRRVRIRRDRRPRVAA
jgi:hypothetical protein